MRRSVGSLVLCFQTDSTALLYAGILNTDDGGQLPAVCIKTLDVLLGVILFAFIFSFILFFCKTANYVTVWTRSRTVQRWNQYCHFDLRSCAIAVIEQSLVTGGCGAHTESTYQKNFFLWAGMKWTIKKKKTRKKITVVGGSLLFHCMAFPGSSSINSHSHIHFCYYVKFCLVFLNVFFKQTCIIFFPQLTNSDFLYIRHTLITCKINVFWICKKK